MVFASVRAQRFSLRERALTQVSLANNEHFQTAPLKTEHASTCKNMRTRQEQTMKFCEHFEHKPNSANTAKF